MKLNTNFFVIMSTTLTGLFVYIFMTTFPELSDNWFVWFLLGFFVITINVTLTKTLSKPKNKNSVRTMDELIDKK